MVLPPCYGSLLADRTAQLLVCYGAVVTERNSELTARGGRLFHEPRMSRIEREALLNHRIALSVL